MLPQALVLRQCALQLLLQGLDSPFEFLLPIRGANAIGGLHPFHDDTNAEICSELSLKVLYLLSYPLVNILLYTLPPAEAKPQAPDFVLSDALLRWFAYHRQREESKKGAVGSPPTAPADNPALNDVLAGIGNWLTPPHASDGLFQAGGGVPDKSLAGYSRLEFTTGSGWKLKAAPATATPELGGVIAADILAFPARGGQPDTDKYVLHVAVLDDAWQYTRVRARILRNLRDENDDNELDIDPGFIMASGRSDWVSYGRDVRRLGENTGTPIPEPARKLQIRNLSLDAWLNTKDTSTDFGPILSEVLSRTYQTTTGQMTFWNLSRIRSATFSVSGLVQQPLPDFHPRQSPKGAETQGIAARGDVLTRQFLVPPGPKPVSAANIDTLVTAVEKSKVRTAFPLFQITWELPRGAMSPLPLLEVTWPVDWMTKG